MTQIVPPIALAALLAVGSTAQAQDAGKVDVPLELWTSETWPNGLVLGETNGVSMGDYDADGWVDIFALQSGNLWRNVDGTDWELAGNLLGLMPPATTRYGSSFGDYDNDGLPDIGTEPRDGTHGDTCFRLLRNLGGGPNFVDVSADPQVVDVSICAANSETLCWGDVDGDRNLDLILPIYPPTPCGVLAGPGNAFLYNLGPSGPGGAYAFQEMTAAAGLTNAPGCRPEGAQFVDIDFDGDIDFYTGGGLYRNLSVTGTPLFDLVTDSAGIQFTTVRDEGLAFFDKDLDGDFDLFIDYISSGIGVRIYEARGDGSFVLLPKSTIEDRRVGIKLGLSYADWDNDGDIDFTTRHVFRKNMLAETGTATFRVATHAIPPEHLQNLTPAWADWDRDGDVDAALANWKDLGHLYENVLYNEETAQADRRFVRVRTVNDSATVPMGLETEYGAVAEVEVLGDSPGIRRRQFAASSSGYLNQNEYGLHFALPDDPAPSDPAIDLLFDVTVDFPGTPDVGYVRVDKLVNPVLGRIRFDLLEDREIHVFRSGRVILDGFAFQPTAANPTVLTTTNGGLQSPTPTAAVARLVPGTANQFVGIELDTLSATAPLRVTEVILEGQVARATTCGGNRGNVLIWDVTTPARPLLVDSFEATTVATNDRSYVPINVVLQPSRTYRLVAAVTHVRNTGLVQVPGPVHVTGGLAYSDPDPCSGAEVAGARVAPSEVPLAIRYHTSAGSALVDLGYGIAGTAGIPQLTCSTVVQSGQPLTILLTGAAPNAPAGVVVGSGTDAVGFLGGVLVPTIGVLLTGLQTDASGNLSEVITWPTTATPGTSLFLQAGVLDLGAPEGIALTNAIAAITQP